MTLPVVRDSQPAARWDPCAEFEDLYDRIGALMGPVLAGPARQLACGARLFDLAGLRAESIAG